MLTVTRSFRPIFVVSFWIVHGSVLAQDAVASEADAGILELGRADSVAPQPAATEATNEVSAHDVASDAERLQQSAEAVLVIDLRQEQGHAADLGEVLARAQGIAVLRDGGLGSGMRFSLNGLYDDQIRFFLDEVPLALAGYAIDIANVPVNLIERVEVYRGVVPIRFGADALGGVVNLVTDRSYQSDAGVSYQVGSFGTHRVTLHGRYRHEPSGFVAGGEAFFDRADNDYDVTVGIPDETDADSVGSEPASCRERARIRAVAVRSEALLVKDYLHYSSGWQRTPGGEIERAVDQHALGFGDALRFQLAPFLLVKASYEFAMRNLTDTLVFDTFGVQRPGRAYYAKLIADM